MLGGKDGGLFGVGVGTAGEIGMLTGRSAAGTGAAAGRWVGEAEY